jgi:hypothetical protein
MNHGHVTIKMFQGPSPLNFQRHHQEILDVEIYVH